MHLVGVGTWPASTVARARDVASADASTDWQLPLAAGLAVTGAYVTTLALFGSGMPVTVLAMAIIALAVVSPISGLAAITFLIPVREGELFAPLYLNGLVVGATTLGCLFRFAGDRRPIHIHPGMVLLIGYGFYSGVSVIPALNGYPAAWASSSALSLINIVSGIGVVIVALYLFRHVPSWPFLVIAVGSAALAALTGLAEYLQVHPLLAIVGGLLEPIAGDRANGGFSNANYFGFFLAQATLLAIGVWLAAGVRLRLVVSAILVMLVVALVLTYSRSGYVAVTAGVIVLVGLKNPVAAIAIALAAALLALIAWPLFLEARLGTDVLLPKETLALAQSEGWRKLSFEAGLAIFAGAPIFGVGFGFFEHFSPPFIGPSPATASHDQFISILAEQGIVGVLMVGVLILIVIVQLWRSHHPLRFVALAMVAAYLIQTTFINSMTSFQISGFTWLMIAAALSAVAPAIRGSDNREN